MVCRPHLRIFFTDLFEICQSLRQNLTYGHPFMFRMQHAPCELPHRRLSTVDSGTGVARRAGIRHLTLMQRIDGQTKSDL